MSVVSRALCKMEWMGSDSKNSKTYKKYLAKLILKYVIEEHEKDELDSPKKFKLEIITCLKSACSLPQKSWRNIFIIIHYKALT